MVKEFICQSRSPRRRRFSSPGGGNGNSLQYSCLENSVDRGAWRATVHEVAKSLDRHTINNKEAGGFQMMRNTTKGNVIK